MTENIAFRIRSAFRRALFTDYKSSIIRHQSSIFLACLAILLAGPLAASELSEPVSTSGRIVIVEDPAATVAFNPQPAPIRRMVQQGLLTLTAKNNEKAAWLSLVSTNDKVGIKVFSAPGASGTRKPVVEAIIQGLIDTGVPPNQIIVWDRRLADLRQAGYFDLAERYRVRVAGALEAGFDENQFYETALLGKLVYGDLEFGKTGEKIGRRSFVSTLVTSNITKIVNVVPLLNNNIAGVVGCLHSMALGSIDNTLRFEAEPDRLSTAIPEIYGLEPIADKVVLNIVDALISQFQGEERTLLHYSTALNELWFSRDPVALDVLSVSELAKQRKEAGAPPLRVNMDIFSNAGLLELGQADSSRFNVERVKPGAE